MRSGTAARLAGLPVTTLRVWERRYGVVAAPKTDTGQRLYSALDVQRLTLLKRLSDRGHAIGTIAPLALDELQTLAAGEPAASDVVVPPPRRVAVVGQGVALRLSALPGCEVLAVYEDLDAAEAACVAAPAAGPAAGTADVMLLQLASLQPATVARIVALRERWRAGSVVVLYGFAARAVLEALRDAGVAVRREPASRRELARLIALPDIPVPRVAPPPRRFSDAVLATLAEMPSNVACECPRHVAELVMQLGNFERYSADCGSRNPADAALHEQLSALAGNARAMFEQALERIVSDEGLVLPMPAALR